MFDFLQKQKEIESEVSSKKKLRAEIRKIDADPQMDRDAKEELLKEKRAELRSLD